MKIVSSHASATIARLSSVSSMITCLTAFVAAPELHATEYYWNAPTWGALSTTNLFWNTNLGYWRTQPAGGTPAPGFADADVFHANGRSVATQELISSTFGSGAAVTLVLDGGEKDQVSVKAVGSGVATLPTLVSKGGVIAAAQKNGEPHNLHVETFVAEASGVTLLNASSDANGRTLNLSINRLSGAGAFGISPISGNTRSVKLSIADASAYTGDFNFNRGVVNFDSDVVSGGSLTLGGTVRLVLDQALTFKAVTINGTPLEAGTHSFARLAGTHNAFFAPGGRGTITVGDAPPPTPAAEPVTSNPAAPEPAEAKSALVGLLADQADFERLREIVRQPGLHQDLARYVQACADRELDEPVITRVVIGRRMLYTSRTVLRRVINGGITYQLTGDTRYARRALADLQAAATFPNWNPSHFLDTAEMSCAFALGLDWLRDAMTADERRQLEDALIRLGLEPGVSPPNRHWIGSDNNWNAVCHGSLAMGALAVRHRPPDLAEALISRAIENLPRHGRNFAPDGAFVEGPMYWDYGTAFHVLAIEALRRETGSARDLDRLPGFRESGAYMAHMTGPTGEFFNYSDARPFRMSLPALAWFGRHYDEPWLTRHEAARYAEVIRGPLPPTTSEEHRLFALALLWLDPAHLESGASAEPPLAWSGGGPNPVALWRDAWTPDAIWVGAKGGRGTLSHGHLDAGSFVFEAGGVRWAVDPGMEEYNRIESMGIDLWGDGRWALFRIGHEGHSIPRLDGVRPDRSGSCPRIAWTTTPRPLVTFDLTRLYPQHLTRLHRTIAAQDDGWTSWRDEIDGLAAGQTYRFTWLTTAEVEIDAAGVTLIQSGRRLRIEVIGDQPSTISVIDAATLYKQADTPVPGLKRVEFAVKSPGSAFSLTLSAALIP